MKPLPPEVPSEGKGYRNLAWIIAILGVIFAVSGIVWMEKEKQWHFDPANYIKLPPEAKVLKVEPGEWAGDVDISFTLPATSEPEDNLESMWKANFKLTPKRDRPNQRYATDSHHNMMMFEYVDYRKEYRYEYLGDK